jgi:protein SCO1/2
MSIDYRKDSVPVLKKYSEKLGIQSDDWHLVQLKKEQINAVANQFFNVAFEDDSAPGGFDHSGRLILIDGQGHIRSYADGTDPDSVDKLAGDIRRLFHEMD